jgi:hypothetical protein
MGFFGIVYSGASYWKTGDWAVLSDDRKSVTVITLDDICQQLISIGFRGAVWISLDSPHSGKWVLEMNQNFDVKYK